jgi:hypothetical protein
MMKADNVVLEKSVADCAIFGESDAVGAIYSTIFEEKIFWVVISGMFWILCRIGFRLTP